MRAWLSGAVGRRPAGRLVAAVALALGATVLAGCSTLHEGLGTTNAPCYVALPAAEAAVHHTGHLLGVRLTTVASVHYRRIQAALRADKLTSGHVCLVAYEGNFSASSVSRPSGRSQGHLAVVVLKYPSGDLVSTVLFRHLPIRFGHPHLL